jgi:hypothetical protein
MSQNDIRAKRDVHKVTLPDLMVFGDVTLSVQIEEGFIWIKVVT